MKICVCLKQVPSREAPVYLNQDKQWISEPDSRLETNEADNYALEQALQFKDSVAAEVIVLSLGPDRVAQTIKEALAKGADRGIHILAESEHTLDPLQLATAMAAAIRDENCELIFSGLQSDDQGFAQTGVMMAECLGYPHASIAIDMQLNDDRVRVLRELEAGWSQWLEMRLPCALTIQSGMNKPRYANMKGILAAKKKPVKKIQLADVLPSNVVASQRIDKIFVPQRTKQIDMLEGEEAEVAAALVQKLNLA